MSNKKAKAQLAVGAKVIQQAKAEVKLVESTRDIKDILRDHVTMAAGNVGVTLSDDIPFEESLAVLRWATDMSHHVGFIIGDIINNGECGWGEKYTAAMEQTGLAKVTLKEYANVARRIPKKDRQSSLGFDHHREVLRLKGREIIPELGKRLDVQPFTETAFAETLKEAGEQAEKGDLPTVRELRAKVKELKGTSTKKKRKSAVDPVINERQQEDTPIEPQSEDTSEGWKPDVLTDDRLIPEELKIVEKIKAYAEGRPEGRCKAFKRFICEGGIL